MLWSVDIPNFNVEDWDTVTECETREEAIRFAQERFGADDEGRICLVTSMTDDAPKDVPA